MPKYESNIREGMSAAPTGLPTSSKGNRKPRESKPLVGCSKCRAANKGDTCDGSKGWVCSACENSGFKCSFKVACEQCRAASGRCDKLFDVCKSCWVRGLPCSFRGDVTSTAVAEAAGGHDEAPSVQEDAGRGDGTVIGAEASGAQGEQATRGDEETIAGLEVITAGTRTVAVLETVEEGDERAIGEGNEIAAEQELTEEEYSQRDFQTLFGGIDHIYPDSYLPRWAQENADMRSTGRSSTAHPRSQHTDIGSAAVAEASTTNAAEQEVTRWQGDPYDFESDEFWQRSP